jgi:hypothetical protein
MAATTAIIAIGRMHQNDGCIVPSHLAQLHEGHRAAWSLHTIGTHPASPTVWSPDTPDRHFVVLLALIASRVLNEPVADDHLLRRRVHIDEKIAPTIDQLAELTRTSRGLGLSATIHPSSTLHEADLIGLTELDIEISRPTYSRQWSHWANAWEVRDER